MTWASLAVAAICSEEDTLLHIRFHQERSQLVEAVELEHPAHYVKAVEQAFWGLLHLASGG
jgi:hypothetical protein